jgi:dihydroxyacetone kinase
MTRIFDDPAEFTADAVEGFADLYASYVRAVPGGVVRRSRSRSPKVAVLVGGGSGHYPAFMGVVGPGFADGAVVGNIFTSPSTAQAYSVGRIAQNGGGVIFTYGNYAGDVMNFGLAGERLQADGIDARQLIVTDDIASAVPAEAGKRRGIAGGVVVFKVLGAAAERGLDIDEVERLGLLANARTFTLGVAFSGCTFPGAAAPLFSVPDGMMGLGLGIHGEPGLEDVDVVAAPTLAELLVGKLLAERPAGSGDRVAVVLNGLGSTKYEELFVLWRSVSGLLRDAGLTVVAPEVGELVTSLDMGGVSLTLTWLDDELEPLWLDAASTPAFRRGAIGVVDEGDDTRADDVAEVDTRPVEGDEASRATAAVVLDALRAAQAAVHDAEQELGRLDAVAGDGDHGRGMVRGIDHAVSAGSAAAQAGWGARGVLEAAGDAWAEFAGGTSGVLWGAGLRAFGSVLGNAGRPGPTVVAAGTRAYLQALLDLGKASPGDKTLLDAAVPFVETVERAAGQDRGLPEAWADGVAAAEAGARATAEMSPRVGRARPLAARSIGTPDPGAVSFGICVRAMAVVVAKHCG